MKVSEAIDRLEVGETVWVKGKVMDKNDTEFPIQIGGKGYALNTRANRDVEISLTEPQAEKVEVPDFVAEWLKTNKYSTDIYDLFQAVEYATDSDGFIPENWKWCGEFYDWVSQESDTLYILSDAIRYGYTVKSKRWVVKAGDYHSTYVDSLTITSEKSRHTISGKEKAHYFTDRSKAEAVATLVDGSVEEV